MPENFDWDVYLAAEWGETGRKLGWAMKEEIAKMCREVGREKVANAVHQAALHGVCKIAYVRGILYPKQKSQPALVGMVKANDRAKWYCDICKNEFLWNERCWCP